jgi:hypothetical protein
VIRRLAALTEGHSLLGCDVVLVGRNLLTFRNNSLLPSAGYNKLWQHIFLEVTVCQTIRRHV